MNFFSNSSFLISFLLLLMFFPFPSCATSRKPTFLLQQQPLILHYHNGPLLKGNLTLNLHWYGNSPLPQHSVNSPKAPSPYASSSTEYYKGGPLTLVIGNQVLDLNYSPGKMLKSPQMSTLEAKFSSISKNNGGTMVNLILIAADVVVDGFCLNKCETHCRGSRQ